MPFHIVALVSCDPLILSIASLAFCMFSWASRHGGLAFLLLIPWYVVVWLIVASLAPCRSNSGGIRVSISSCM